MTADEWISRLKLQPHPEGGFFRETFRSKISVQSPRANAKRAAVTDIYFLLRRDQFSRFHKVAHDEIWNFYDGDPLQLFDYDPETQHLSSCLLGPPPAGDSFKYVIPGGHWQAAEPTGEFALVGCTVAPGFDFEDFSFLDPESDVVRPLMAKYPTMARFF